MCHATISNTNISSGLQHTQCELLLRNSIIVAFYFLYMFNYLLSKGF